MMCKSVLRDSVRIIHEDHKFPTRVESGMSARRSRTHVKLVDKM